MISDEDAADLRAEISNLKERLDRTQQSLFKLARGSEDDSTLAESLVIAETLGVDLNGDYHLPSAVRELRERADRLERENRVLAAVLRENDVTPPPEYSVRCAVTIQMAVDVYAPDRAIPSDEEVFDAVCETIDSIGFNKDCMTWNVEAIDEAP